ncbi:hypothetical protein IFM58399_05027 [Aspergillus lentulus]|uniref:Uncharacterized protein n=1 Tax=Aspergillus lentulus TaxID=293939 RepID=A0ABQ1ADV2_ASPLE|nr:uncharacterized protein IFM58399_05027 [Aspergillus lentulus]GFF37825.1 hypothetical protein IFM58399_05027 [Aspergillus lentulus]GFF57688.1 hypothetical protein IFM62136_03528 [Aspergillus lentulus]GFF79704.1 hypothetical protein IFM60648_05540 [Aspergillus lentulus]
MRQQTDLQWKQVSASRWERGIDEVEQFYTSLAKSYEGSGRNFFAITGFVSFSVKTDDGVSQEETRRKVEDALRKAWVHLRFDHPTIASWVEWDSDRKRCKKIYESPAGQDGLQLWLETTFLTISNGVSGLEWCNSDPPVPKLPTLFLIWPSPRVEGLLQGDLVLRAHHDIIDGVGTLMLFDNLFTHAARAYKRGSDYPLPCFGIEYANLSPPFRVAAGLQPSMSPEQTEKFESIRAYNAFMKQDPGRRLGLSVTHAYHTAIAMAVRDLQERRDSERLVRYINYSLINERGHCLCPYDTPLHAAAVYHSVSCRLLVVDTTVPSITDSSTTEVSREEFLRVAKTVREFYREMRRDKDYIQMIPSWYASNTIPYPHDDATLPIPEPNQSPSVSISSLGVVDNVISPSHGTFELDSPWVTGEELGTGLGLFLGTWKGVLTLSAAYNDAWHDKEEVVEFIERCNVIVVQGLGSSKDGLSSII